MMKWVFSVLISVSVVFGLFTNKISDVSNAAIDSGTKAVTLTLTLLGSMGMWGGLMRVAEKSGLCKKISKLLSPFVCLIFKGINKQGKAFNAISMNITANLLGLGNAATPLGLEAMKELEKEECSDNPENASRNMVMLAVLNSASIQLLPTTVAALRLAHGAENPLDILPPVLIVSVIALAVGITVVFCLNGVGNKGERVKSSLRKD